MRVLFVVVTMVVYSSGATAQSNCSEIKNDKDRLACFDKASVTKANPKKAGPEEKVFAELRTQVLTRLRDPESARFGAFSRGIRLDSNNKRRDTVCGSVNAKNAYGGYTGMRPLVYFVDTRELHIADDSSLEGQLADTIYKITCLR